MWQVAEVDHYGLNRYVVGTRYLNLCYVGGSRIARCNEYAMNAWHFHYEEQAQQKANELNVKTTGALIAAVLVLVTFIVEIIVLAV